MRAGVLALAIPRWNAVPLDTVKADVLAGITVSLVAVPQSLAYAQLAGVPPIHGLYAAFIPTIVGALFGSSKIVSTGPVAMTSLLTSASVAPLAAQGTDVFTSYVVLLALLSGLFQVAFGLLRMGVLLNFLSHPVLMGFINAAAIIIALSQLPMLLGIPAPQSNHFLLDILNVIMHIDRVESLTLCFGLASLLALLVFKKKLPNWPGVLITVTTLTLVSYAMGFEKVGGRVVGVVPECLPTFSVPPLDWRATVSLLPAGFVIALISFMEAMSSAKVIAIRTRTPWDEDRELIGQGLAKIAAAFCHSMPVSGSFSRSALNLASGAVTKLSSLVSAAAVVLTLLVLTPLLHHLPKAVLAAIIMVAVANLVNIRIISNAWRANVDDGIAGSVTFFATLLFAPNIQNGILTGILLSLALLLYRLMRPRIATLGLMDDNTLRDSLRHRIDPLGRRLAALRFDGALLFINVAYFEDALINLERGNSELSHILVKCSGINRIDASGIEKLFELVERFKATGITLAFSGLKEQPSKVMQRSGLMRAIGAENVYANDQEALHSLRALWSPGDAHRDGASMAPSAPRLASAHTPQRSGKKSVAVRPAFRIEGSMKLLVAVDGSPASSRAVEMAVLMAKSAPEGHVLLLHAQSADGSNISTTDVLMSGPLEDFELERVANAALKGGVELCQAAGVAFATRKERGPTAETIVRVAAEEKADQILMGVQRSTYFGGWLFARPVSAQVAEMANVPVTLVR